MNELIKEIKKLYKLKPYSYERYKQLEFVKELENKSNVKHISNNPDTKNKSILIDIVRKDKTGLYETIIQFTIKNIKLED